MRKIAVVNRTNLKNYGSVLQVYALVEAIKKMGYESEVVWETGNLSRNFDFRIGKILHTGLKVFTHPSLILGTVKTIGEVKKKEIPIEVVNKFDDFVKENIEQKTFTHTALVEVAKSDEYYKFVCGSDQIWCSTTTYVDPLMYLRFTPKEKRIAYAPSIGRDYIPRYNIRQMKRYINDIPCVSIREEDGKRLIRELTGRDVPVVLDPTLLHGREEWDKLKTLDAVPNSKFLLCYFLDEPQQQVVKEIIQCARKTGSVVVSLGSELHVPKEEIEVITYPCGPSEFLGLIDKADMVITDSYHGMLFSIIYEKTFWSVERNYQQFDQSSRQLTILSALNLKERYQKRECSFGYVPIDYQAVNERVLRLRETSINYLKGAIEK